MSVTYLLTKRRTGDKKTSIWKEYKKFEIKKLKTMHLTLEEFSAFVKVAFIVHWNSILNDQKNAVYEDRNFER